MTPASKAIDYLRCITTYKDKAVVILLEEDADKIAALIKKQERMIERAAEIMGNAFCVEDGPCPENYIEVGCKPCVLKWLEGEADKC